MTTKSLQDVVDIAMAQGRGVFNVTVEPNMMARQITVGLYFEDGFAPKQARIEAVATALSNSPTWKGFAFSVVEKVSRRRT